MTVHYVTKEVYEKLQGELRDLKTRGRKEAAERIKVAKEFGDLSENAEYYEALEGQRTLERQIAELEEILRNAKIVKPKKTGDKIDIGMTFEVDHVVTGKKLTLTLVGFGEAEPSRGKISPESPMGKVFMGKKPGDEVEVEVDHKKIKYRVVRFL